MLTIEQIKNVCASEREDWQHRVNQGVLKQALGASSLSISESVQALGAMEAIDKLLRALIREEEFTNSPARLAAANSPRPPRARPILIPEKIRGGKKDK